MSVTAAMAMGRAVIERTLMPDTCEIQSVTLTPDGYGDNTEVWATDETVACQVSDLSAREAQIADKLSEVVDYQITLPATTDVTAQNRIRHTRNAVVTVFSIVGVRDRPSIELARTVLARIARP